MIYTDAFFELGDQRWRPGDPDLPQHISKQQCIHCNNGWGFVFILGDYVTYGHGSVSLRLLARFCTRRAYIYFLEIFAQLMAFSVHVRALPAFWLSYVDNQPGMTALAKGFGRDEQNVLLTSFWGMATAQRWVPDFRWVPSNLNIADPISRSPLLATADFYIFTVEGRSSRTHR